MTVWFTWVNPRPVREVFLVPRGTISMFMPRTLCLLGQTDSASTRGGSMDIISCVDGIAIFYHTLSIFHERRLRPSEVARWSNSGTNYCRIVEIHNASLPELP